MKLRTDRHWLRRFSWIENAYVQRVVRWLLVGLFLAVLLLVCATPAHAQAAQTDAQKLGAYTEGNNLINKEMEKQIKNQGIHLAAETETHRQFTLMKKWQKRYNAYLETVSGFASALKAGTSIYANGMKVALTLGKLTKAVEHNPQGIVGTAQMNNLYMETFAQFCITFTMLKQAVAKGGPKNMLNGRERCEMLYDLEDQMKHLLATVTSLYMSVRRYELIDVLYNRMGCILFAGRRERLKAAAQLSLHHWRKNATDTWIYR